MREIGVTVQGVEGGYRKSEYSIKNVFFERPPSENRFSNENSKIPRQRSNRKRNPPLFNAIPISPAVMLKFLSLRTPIVSWRKSTFQIYVSIYIYCMYVYVYIWTYLYFPTHTSQQLRIDMVRMIRVLATKTSNSNCCWIRFLNIFFIKNRLLFNIGERVFEKSF